VKGKKVEVLAQALEVDVMAVQVSAADLEEAEVTVEVLKAKELEAEAVKQAQKIEAMVEEVSVVSWVDLEASAT
jgi:hypothetical protein